MEIMNLIPEDPPNDRGMLRRNINFTVQTWWESKSWGSQIKSQLCGAFHGHFVKVGTQEFSEGIRRRATGDLLTLPIVCEWAFEEREEALTICQGLGKLLEACTSKNAKDFNDIIHEVIDCTTCALMVFSVLDGGGGGHFISEWFETLLCRLCKHILQAEFVALITNAATIAVNSDRERKFADGPALEALVNTRIKNDWLIKEDIAGERLRLFQSLLEKRQSITEPTTARELTQWMIKTLERNISADKIEWDDLIASIHSLQSIHSKSSVLPTDAMECM